MSRTRIAPSLLACDLAHVADEVRSVEAAGADLLHFDVMDGHFVPNLTFGPGLCAAVRSLTRLPLDVHLMVTNPDALVEAFVEAGANRVSVHVEAVTHLHRSLTRHPGARCSAGCGAQPRNAGLGPGRDLALRGLRPHHVGEPRLRWPAPHPRNAGQDREAPLRARPSAAPPSSSSSTGASSRGTHRL